MNDESGGSENLDQIDLLCSSASSAWPDGSAADTPEASQKGKCSIDFEQLRNYIAKQKIDDNDIQQDGRSRQKYSSFDHDKRFSFYSEESDLIQATNFFSLFEAKQSLLSQYNQKYFWIDLSNPTEDELKLLAQAFSIHPLTIEDIETFDTREKCEVFDQYVLLSMNTEAEDDKIRNIYALLYPSYVLTIHYTCTDSIKNILCRISSLKVLVQMSSEWIVYALLDEIIDYLMPIIDSVEIESEIIEDLTTVLSENEQADLLTRVAVARKKVTFLQRILRPKYDIVKQLTKKCQMRISKHCLLYLRDIQDNIIQLSQALENCADTLNRSHANYLDQISIEVSQASNRMGEVMKKFTVAASILLPLQLISGIWGMNISVPGQRGVTAGDCVAFFAICGSMIFVTLLLVFIGRRQSWFVNK